MRFTLFYVIILFITTSYAESVDNKAIDKFKSYLEQIKTLAVDFKQVDSKGEEAHGKLLINKPYTFRCNYYPPFPLVIIGNKNYVTVYDYDMKQASRIKSSENIFNFLLADQVDFDKYFQFEVATENESEIYVRLYHDLSERRSAITINKNSGQITNMKILEEDNVIEISFSNALKVQKFDENLFIFKNPEIFGPPERLDKTALEQRYYF
jgi:outer membrane lipoprotein-sorting protein